MRLYFFPALLPLAPLLPWLLTALGALAALVRKLKHVRAATWIAALCFVAAAGTWAWQKSKLPSAETGTRLTPTEELPQPEPLEAMDSTQSKQGAKNSKQGLLTDVWYHMSAHRLISAALVSPDWIITGSMEGDVQAISTRTGETGWRVRKRQAVLSPAATLGQVVLVGEGLHTAQSSGLTALDLGTGRPLWQREFLSHIESAPAVDAKAGRLYISTGSQGVWALDAADGAVVWHAALGHADATPLLMGDSLWVAAQPQERNLDSRLYELDPKTGKTRWSIQLPGQPWGTPQPGPDGLLLITTGIGQIAEPAATDRGWSHGISLKDRKLAWSVPLDTMAMLSSTQHDGLVIHTLKLGKIVALNARTGAPAWSFELGTTCLSPATIVGNGWVAALPDGGDLVLLDARTGKLLQRTPAAAGAIASPLYSAATRRLFTIGGDSLSAFDVGP